MWQPFGRFHVGIVEAERDSEGSQPVAGRIYYPAASPPAAGSVSAWLPWRWRGVGWLWDVHYARGLGKFLFFRLPKTWFYEFLKQGLIAFSWAAGKSQRMDLTPGGGALALGAPEQLPLVIFSHGLGGNRFLYSIICSELASQGYVVLAVEHADGTACAVRLPRGQWKLYGGLGDEEAQVAKTRMRVKEMKAALQLMQALHRGDRNPGLQLSYGLDAATFLRGRLDMRCLAAAGHSYGGATITALVAEDPVFRCGVALDPWWHAVFPESKALTRFATCTPLLIMGSHDWNVPNAFGQLACGGERQEKVLAAARAWQEGRQRSGGGAMLLCIAGSSHNTFADALPLFGQKTGWLLERLGLTARLDPVLGIHLCTTAVLNFLGLHLPLTQEQREVQNWEPAKGHSALDRILERDAADRGERRGALSWLFPGRGLINSVSDYFLDRLLPRPSAFRQAANGGMPAGTPRAQQAKGEEAAAEEEADGDGAFEPGDVLTGQEAAEAALPSADPASGVHPHAPSALTDAPPLTGAMQPGDSSGGGGQRRLTTARRAALRAGVNRRCNGKVEASEVEEVQVLLGEEHVWKCIVV